MWEFVALVFVVGILYKLQSIVITFRSDEDNETKDVQSKRRRK